MTKKKNALLHVLFLLGFCGILIGVLTLTGCNNSNNDITLRPSQPLGDIVFHGDNYFMTSDVLNLTNQEMLDLMLEIPMSVHSLTTLADHILLRSNFEIEEARVRGIIEEVKLTVPDFDFWLVHNGFENEAALVRQIELYELRHVAARRLVNVSNADVRAFFDAMPPEDGVNFVDVRDAIYEHLIEQETNYVMFQELVRLRHQAEFEIFNDQLAEAYRDYLASTGFGITLRAAGTPTASNVIARINDIDITIGQLFHVLTSEIGLAVAVTELDEELLEGVAIETLIEPSEDRLREIHAELGPTVTGSHILVEDYDTAIALIDYLQATTDFQTRFAELASIYSRCPSGERGGDLGEWEICPISGPGCMVAEFDEAVMELEVGAFTLMPVETEFGFHIIYKTNIQEVPSFRSMRDDLKEAEMERMLQDPVIIGDLFMELRQGVGITFINPTLQAQFQSFFEL